MEQGKKDHHLPVQQAEQDSGGNHQETRIIEKGSEPEQDSRWTSVRGSLSNFADKNKDWLIFFGLILDFLAGALVGRYVDELHPGSTTFVILVLLVFGCVFLIFSLVAQRKVILWAFIIAVLLLGAVLGIFVYAKVTETPGFLFIKTPTPTSTSTSTSTSTPTSTPTPAPAAIPTSIGPCPAIIDLTDLELLTPNRVKQGEIEMLAQAPLKPVLAIASTQDNGTISVLTRALC